MDIPTLFPTPALKYIPISDKSSKVLSFYSTDFLATNPQVFHNSKHKKIYYNISGHIHHPIKFLFHHQYQTQN